MTKKELKEEIFLALHNKRMLYKLKLPKPKEKNTISSYYAEVKAAAMRIDIKQKSIRIMDYKIENDIIKYRLIDIYNELKTK